MSVNFGKSEHLFFSSPKKQLENNLKIRLNEEKAL